MKYFIALITFTSPDGHPLDFGDYCAGVCMWLCITVGISFGVWAFRLWSELP